ncbi:Mu transposase C-terminal domain-containing protein [Methylocaldum sp. MU1018]
MSIEYHGQRYYEAAELAGKPGMPIRQQEINTRWGKDKPRKTKKELGLNGKGWLYPESCLPKEAQAFLLERRTKEAAQALCLAPPAASVPAAPVAGGPLTSQQEVRDQSRQAIWAFIRRYPGSQGEAVAYLNEAYANGTLHQDLVFAIEHSNAKSNAERFGKLALDTVKKWPGIMKKRGSMADRKTREKVSYLEVPWLPYYLARYRTPAHPTHREAWRSMTGDLRAIGWAEKDIPGDGAVYRVVRRVPVTILEKGRATGAAWKAILPCIRRDWSGLKSNDVWVGDGHTFKAKVQHPDHGRPFAPEVTLVIDAPSRYVVGWTVSLSENCVAVAEALGRAMTLHGKPLIYYSDNGAGQTAKTIDAPVTGLLARLGVAHETGIPGNPQGRGIIERLWQTLTIPLARAFPTCQTKTMDRETLNNVTRKIQSDLKKGRVPNIVPSWMQFIDALDAAIEDYNANHPHRELGKRTPKAVYEANLDPLTAVPLSPEEIVGLFRPEVIRTPARGEVRLFNNRYFLRDLADLPAGTPVRAAFDIHDAGKVWVKDMAGRSIGVAVWDGNKVDGFAKPFIEQLKEERVEGMRKRAQDKIETAEAELGRTLTVIPETVLPPDLMLTKRKLEQRAYEIEAAEAVSTLPPSPVGGAVHSAMETRRGPLARPAAADGVSTVVSMASVQEDRDATDAWWKERHAHYEGGGRLMADEVYRMNSWARCVDFKVRRRRELNGEEPDWASYLIPVPAIDASTGG